MDGLAISALSCSFIDGRAEVAEESLNANVTRG